MEIILLVINQLCFPEELNAISFNNLIENVIDYFGARYACFRSFYYIFVSIRYLLFLFIHSIFPTIVIFKNSILFQPVTKVFITLCYS